MKYVLVIGDGMADYPIQELGNKNLPQAANNLLSQAFSQFKSPEQLYALPSINQIKLVSEAIQEWYFKPRTPATPTSRALVIIAVVGATIFFAN